MGLFLEVKAQMRRSEHAVFRGEMLCLQLELIFRRFKVFSLLCTRAHGLQDASDEIGSTFVYLMNIFEDMKELDSAVLGQLLKEDIKHVEIWSYTQLLCCSISQKWP